MDLKHWTLTAVWLIYYFAKYTKDYLASALSKTSKRCHRVWFFCESNVDQMVMHTTHTHNEASNHQKSAPLFFLFFYCLSPTVSGTDPNLILQPLKHYPFFRNTRLRCFVSHNHLSTTQSSALFPRTKSAVSHRTCELQPNSLILQHGSIDVNDSRWVTTKKVVFCVTLFSFSLQLLRLIFVKMRNVLMFKIQIAKNKLINHIQTTDFHTSSPKM